SIPFVLSAGSVTVDSSAWQARASASTVVCQAIGVASALSRRLKQQQQQRVDRTDQPGFLQLRQRKPRQQIASQKVRFLSMAFVHVCYLILVLQILSYLLVLLSFCAVSMVEL